jgi:hypothetical protein
VMHNRHNRSFGDDGDTNQRDRREACGPESNEGNLPRAGQAIEAEFQSTSAGPVTSTFSRESYQSKLLKFQSLQYDSGGTQLKGHLQSWAKQEREVRVTVFLSHSEPAARFGLNRCTKKA